MVTLLALLFATPAHAAAREPIPAESGIRVVNVGRKDAFWRMKDVVVGLVCVVEDPGLVPQGRRWWAGAARCSDGLPYFFFQVDVEPVSPDVVAAAFEGRPRHAPVLSTTEPVAPEELAPDTISGAAASPGATPPAPGADLPPDAWLPGTRVRVVAIAPRDQYAGRKDLLGATCEVAEDPLVPAEERWRTGAVLCGEEELYFYKATFEAVADDAPLGPAPTPSRSRR